VAQTITRLEQVFVLWYKPCSVKHLSDYLRLNNLKDRDTKSRLVTCVALHKSGHAFPSSPRHRTLAHAVIVMRTLIDLPSPLESELVRI
jgi:hypothetical protein